MVASGSAADRRLFYIYVVGIFVSYLIYGYVQELMFRTKGLKQFGWYITLVQFVLYTIFSWTHLKVQKISVSKVPLTTFFGIAIVTVGTMGLSNSSLTYLNYPTQVVFKSSKLIPVMIGGVLIQKKKYRLLDYTASGMLSLGLIVFTLADVQLSPRYNSKGLVLISLALCADAVIGNVQEKVMRVGNVGTVEMVHKSYMIGTVLIFLWTILTGEFGEAFVFCSEHHFADTYFPMTMFALSGYVGVNFVLSLVKLRDALTAVTVTTLRKGATMILSFVFFPKPFTVHYLWGGALIMGGLAVQNYAKLQAKKQALQLLPISSNRI